MGSRSGALFYVLYVNNRIKTIVITKKIVKFAASNQKYKCYGFLY